MYSFHPVDDNDHVDITVDVTVHELINVDVGEPFGLNCGIV